MRGWARRTAVTATPSGSDSTAVEAGMSSFSMNVVAGALRYRYSANPPLKGVVGSRPMPP
jgi:hypothetical protein